MPETRVVNLRRESYDVYIGRGRERQEPRPCIYGNPYSHMSGTLAKFRVANRDEACDRHMDDLRALSRESLIVLLTPLVGKRLGCFCKPLRCHGDNYVQLIRELGLE